ncbi:hypothetical protein IFM89_002576 [Coptis chinensis]|uniref:C2 NT-type domain-containing protein n=1 Tax=Coptis chinensis TaxID=261450 RepID=A0A835LKC3_9MAGN|nr:hypothetical protein IFM89_002576 [Coptis chinensis]
MVLGLRSKSRKGTSIHVDYLLHVQEIKPWPPSQSMISHRSVLLQWENGDKNSGSTNTVVPVLGSGVGDGKIEFNESFKIHVTLSREVPVKGGETDTFLKNCLEFNLYEPRRDKTVKGQHLGTVIVDLAEYGILKETVIISAPMNCKRSFRNTAQPVLLLKIEPFQKRNSRTSSMESLSKEVSLDKDGVESVATLMNNEYEEEDEVASFTDDDVVSQHSSVTVSSSGFEATGSSPPQSEENAFEAVQNSTGRAGSMQDSHFEPVAAKPDLNPVTTTVEHVTRSPSHSSSVDSSSGVVPLENDWASLSKVVSHTKISAIHCAQSSSSPIAYEEEEDTNGRSLIEQKSELPMKENKATDVVAKVASPKTDTLITYTDSQVKVVDAEKARRLSRVEEDEASNISSSHTGLEEDTDGNKQTRSGQSEETEEEEDHAREVDATYNNSSQNAVGKLGEPVGDGMSSRRDLEMQNNTLSSIKPKHVKSVRSPLDSARSKRFVSSQQNVLESAENNCLEDRSFMQIGRKDTMSLSRHAKSSLSENKVQQLEHKIERLERELREAAALEVALYSVVSEHGSSVNKVHAPARRLARFYLHAWKTSKPRRASAARSAISGLLLVAKACGNDVPRLTFWLSNSVVLRAIISLALDSTELPLSNGPHIDANDVGKGNGKGSPLKWEEFSGRRNHKEFGISDEMVDWEESQTFTTALEKIEAWIFCRVIESVWWQTLTPHMQSTPSNSRNCYGRRPSSSDEEQASFSMELWKKAFKDACDRLCPVRAAGHECGCLPVLAKLVMEQCVNRLDVAMFNAILREDDIPTDPVSDPISDSKVLPIPAGKSSFGAGAQLKNAIGNWSRWLTDLFGIDDDDYHEVQNDLSEDDIQECETSSKSFILLNALSDLMMLPKDMLLSKLIRKEVCPTFGSPLIKKILDDFSPDEFCPDPIPEEVFQALDVEVSPLQKL